ncbi:MAG: cytochrome c oxidase subunit 3 [Bacteroidales bacterium]|nr:cytochrome c oxidase subunit 3 [Bacteroidales bacterium]
MHADSINYKKLLYPPGGILMWIIIFIELVSFGLGLIAYSYFNSVEADTFSRSRSELNAGLATLNTFLLLTSGYFMAMSVLRFKSRSFHKAHHFLWLAMVGGLLFILIKSIEYVGKIESGYTLSANMFFTFYWLLTGFHLVHVAVGIVILLVIGRQLKLRPETVKIEDLEAGAAFWHMCDLIWLLLFPVLYLF